MSPTVDPYLYQVARFLIEQAGDSSPELAQLSEESKILASLHALQTRRMATTVPLSPHEKRHWYPTPQAIGMMLIKELEIGQDLTGKWVLTECLAVISDPDEWLAANQELVERYHQLSLAVPLESAWRTAGTFAGMFGAGWIKFYAAEEDGGLLFSVTNKGVREGDIPKGSILHLSLTKARKEGPLVAVNCE